MSFFSTVKSLLLGSPKTVDDIFDKDDGILVKAGGFIGGLVYSDQEKAEMNKQIVVAAQKFVVDTLDESTERSKARGSRRDASGAVTRWAVRAMIRRLRRRAAPMSRRRANGRVTHDRARFP